MNGRQAIQAMLDGRTVTNTRGVSWRLTPNGFHAWDALLHKWAPCSFLGNSTYELAVVDPNPNPHKPGTYLWAKEEHARGRGVITPAGDRIRADYDWSKVVLYIEEFEGSTWRTDRL